MNRIALRVRWLFGPLLLILGVLVGCSSRAEQQENSRALGRGQPAPGTQPKLSGPALEEPAPVAAPGPDVPGSFRVQAQTVRTTVSPGFNGSVSAITEPDSNGVRYLGGAFTAFDALDTGARALVDLTTGAVNRAFPKVTGGIGSVYASAPDGSGGFYIGGQFTEVDGMPRNNAAHIQSDGSLDPSWNPNLNGNVGTLAVSGSTVYLGGAFTTVGGTTRNRAAAVGTDGTLTAWNPNVGGGSVRTLAVSGSTVYLGGDFTTVGGTSRNYAAAVGTDGTLTSWNPNVNANVYALAVSGSTV